MEIVSTFAVSVNYDRTVEDLVIAGKYTEWDPDLTDKNFPPKRSGAADLEIILVKFERDMKFRSVVRQLDKQGFRPAELLELLAFGEKYPLACNDYRVVALGFRFRSFLLCYVVPCIDNTIRAFLGRRLDARWWGRKSDSSDLFVVIRK